MSFYSYSSVNDKSPFLGQPTDFTSLVLASDTPDAYSGEELNLTLTIYSELSALDLSALAVSSLDANLEVTKGRTQFIDEYLVLVPVTVSGSGGGQITVSFNGAISNGVFVDFLSIPTVEPEPIQDVINDYAALTEALKPKVANSGTVQGKLANSGRVQPSDRDANFKNDALPGDKQEATSRLLSLSESLSMVHLASEVAELNTWVTAQGKDILPTDIIEYQTSLVSSLVRLNLILENYSHSASGSVQEQMGGPSSKSAQSFRFNSGSVFDVYAPATLLNTEYLVQQSSKGTFRQSAIDQLSCFYSWTRAEESTVNQSKNSYAYTTESNYQGGKQNVEVFESGDIGYGDSLNLQVGTDNNVTVANDISFFSMLGNIWLRAKQQLYAAANEIILKAADRIYIKSKGRLVIEARDSVHIMSKNQMVFRADDITFISKNPIRIATGEWPALLETRIAGTQPTLDKSLSTYPTLLVSTFGSDELVTIPIFTSYYVKVVCPIEPILKPLIFPMELLEYPKSGLPKALQQASSGVVSNPTYPAA